MAWVALLGLPAMLAALFGLCVVLVRRAGLCPASAPLAALSLAGLVLFLGGLAGALRPAALTLLVLGLAGGGAEALVSRRRRGANALLAALDHPAAAAFWALALLLALYLARLQPVFLNFDEYSSWGTCARLMSLHHRLYTLCDAGLPWAMTELPALPLMSYLFQWAGDFAHWRAMFAADLLLLAACAAVGGCAHRARTALPLMLAALLVPSLLSVAGHTALLSTAWLEFLGDLPAGMLFGGAVAFWLGARDRGPAPRWLCLPVVLLAANIKTNTLALGLAAAGLIALDALVFAPGGTSKNAGAVLGRPGFALACLAAPMTQYLLWSRHIAGVVRQNAASGGMGDTAGASLPQVVFGGVRMLLGLPVTEYFEARRELFRQYGDALTGAFWSRNVSMLGTGAAVAALVALLFAAALVLGPDARARARTALLGAGSALCFLGYWFMLWLSYAFLIKDSTPADPASYARYFGSYYAGWLLLGLGVLARACAAARRPVLGRAAALAAGTAFAAVFALRSESQFTIPGVSQGEYAAVRAEQAVAEQAAGLIAPGDRVFLIRQGDEGFYWFLYNQSLLPLHLVYGEGGATYGDPSHGDGDPYFAPYTAQEFAAMLADEGADWLLVARIDDVFVDSYAALFTDGLDAALQGPELYRATADGWATAASLGEVTP